MSLDQPFQTLSLVPSHVTGNVLMWELDPAFNEPGPYSYTVQSSQTPDFSQLVTDESVGDTYTYTDTSCERSNFDDSWYYRVILNTGAPNQYVSPNLLYGQRKEDRWKYLKAKEIVRKESLRLRKYTGVEVFLLKYKIYGETDEGAVDPITGLPLGDCTSDYGTGIVGGYHEPLAIWASREQKQKTKNLEGQMGLGIEEADILNLRILSFPIVSVRDIIVFPDDDRRFRVLGEPAPVRTRFPGTHIFVTQLLTLRLIPPSDTVYKIPIS